MSQAKITLDQRGFEYVQERMGGCKIGLGTYQIRSEKVIQEILDAALEVGYRIIDTAQIYGNEKYIGTALKTLLPKYGLTRKDIFITTKLSPANQGSKKCGASVEKSLEDLQTEYIDLFLIHWPGCSKLKSGDEKNKEIRYQSWQCLEEFYKAGRLRSIGVSNYNVNHLEELLERCSVAPAVNQCEYHPHFYTPDIVQYCKEHKIHFQAYSSFGSESNKDDLLSDPAINTMAQKYKTSVTNFLLAWSLCQEMSVLPRSRNPIHVKENFEARRLNISQEDIKSVKKVEQTKYCWDPERVC
ncbi:aldo/keto reductase family domain-containing protein [Ditylenchus destructor]|uniref:Aldo/keto reductase family domain-containing protein n=1 Tax=Ditylenchus destructor TaxID=166010 RepID=A0AAD4RB53_9BILA|nr:aldo/keto reductase family domain-containing protein [Ditylenchus destructor]